MPRFARLLPPDVEGREFVQDPIDAENMADIRERYVEAHAAEFVKVPKDTKIGSFKVDTKWTHPEDIDHEAAPEVRRLQISPPDYQMLYRPAELKLLREKAASTADEDAEHAPVLANWVRLMDDPRTTTVDLAHPHTAEIHDHAVKAGVLTDERRAEIDRGYSA